MNCNSPYATRSRKRNAVANPHATRSKKRKAVANPLQPVEKKSLLDLPYHIITDILIRLPAECVIRCQRASRFLQLLVTTPFFIRTHLARRATSLIALQSITQSTDRNLKFYFIDERDDKKVEEAYLKLDLPYMLKDYPVMLYDSYDGFLLLKNNSGSSNSVFVIWNPTTAEQVTITMEGYEFAVCGFYFNAHNKEYEVLLHYWVVDGGESSYAFDVLSFGSKSRRNIGIYPYVPRGDRPPTIINGTFYWMVEKLSSSEVEVVNCSNSIMAFEIKTNKFSTIQHGGASCDDPYYDHDNMHLIEMQGQLGLCVLMSDTRLVLQVLDPATNSWAKTYNVTLPKLTECPRLKYFSCWPSSLKVEVVNIKDGKLLVRQNHRLFLCDLGLNTRRIVNKRGFKDDNFRPVVHTHSIVSLNTDKMIQLESECV